MASQAVQRISLRWLPEPAFEDTDTIALNVGGYFVDLRVTKADNTIQWSRAGERIPLKSEPRKSKHLAGPGPCTDVDMPTATFRWTHIIDSLDLTVPDEAHFVKLPNGDDLEIGTTPAPHLGGVPTAYEEVWRDVTSKRDPGEMSWILQSSDGTTFVGKVGGTYVAMSKTRSVFQARREDRLDGDSAWTLTFESDAGLPKAAEVIESVEGAAATWTEGQTVRITDTEFVFRGVSTEQPM